MDIEIVSPPQRHMQATPVQHLSAEGIPHRQQSDSFHQEDSLDISYTENMHFTPRERHIQGIPGIDTFSEQHYSSASTFPEQQMSHFQMMTTPSWEATYAPTPQPHTAVTPPFTNTAQMPSFSTISDGDNSQVHISAPSMPVSDLLYSDTLFTPEQKPMQTDSPQVSKISFN